MEQGKYKIKKFLDSITVIKRYRFIIKHKRIEYEVYLEIFDGEVDAFSEIYCDNMMYFKIPEATRKGHYNEIIRRLGFNHKK